jgi:5-methylcytosine-specific restriction endonuclease McrA
MDATITEHKQPVAFQDRKVLQLNKTWHPMHAIPLEKALHMVFNDRARIINPDEFTKLTWDDWTRLKPLGDDGIRAANMVFRVPEIIILNDYDKVPQPRKTFSRRHIYQHYHYTCQYCGAQPGSEELNIDHVIPKAQGGQTTWENCVLACIKCNSKKRDRTPAQAQMTLRCGKPTMPGFKEFKRETMRIKSWEMFLGEAYWTVPLQT